MPKTQTVKSYPSARGYNNAEINNHAHKGKRALDPYYPAYYEDTLLAEAVPISVPLNEKKDYGIDLEAIESRLTEKTQMIWMCARYLD